MDTENSRCHKSGGNQYERAVGIEPCIVGQIEDEVLLTLYLPSLQQRVAELCRSIRLLQEVHGAMFPAEHRAAHDRLDTHIPEVLEGIRPAHPSQ